MTNNVVPELALIPAATSLHKSVEEQVTVGDSQGVLYAQNDDVRSFRCRFLREVHLFRRRAGWRQRGVGVTSTADASQETRVYARPEAGDDQPHDEAASA